MAGAGVRLFTAGSQLLASQVNTYLMDQVVCYFADSASRDAAFGGAGEPSLSPGRIAYLFSDNKLYLYGNDNAWAEIGAQLDNLEVTTAKIDNLAVTEAKLAADSVTSAKIVDGTIVNADINASAAIALSKLASGTAAQVVVHNASGIPTATTITGDVTISSTGVTTIAANSVALGTDTTGNYVATVSGTANQVTVSGSGSESASITVSLPQDIATTSNPTFAGVTATSVNGTTIPSSKTLVVTTDKLSVHAATTSAELAGVISDETGTGSLVFANSPTFTGTVTGNPTAGTTSTGASGFGYMGLPQNASTTGAYGVVAADAGTHIYSSATRTITLPANATIAMPIGSTVVFIAGTGATVTIAITSDTMYLAGPGTTGSRTLAAFGMATAVKITSTSWIISGNGLT